MGQKCQRLDELSNESNQLRWCPVWSLLLGLLVAGAQCSAQLTILNPNHLDVPEEKANALLSTACRVVAQEFHVTDISALRFSLVLVLGEKEEHYTIDEKRLEYKLYMKQWDEAKFAALAMRLCVQRLPTRDQEARLLKEILRRSDKISSISASQLRKDSALRPPALSRSLPSDCMSAVREEPCQHPNAAPP